MRLGCSPWLECGFSFILCSERRRGQKTEDGGQRTEDRGQKTEDRERPCDTPPSRRGASPPHCAPATHFAIGPAADATQQLVIRDHGWRPGVAVLICDRGVLWHAGTFITSRARGKANSLNIYPHKNRSARCASAGLVVPSVESLVKGLLTAAPTQDSLRQAFRISACRSALIGGPCQRASLARRQR